VNHTLISIVMQVELSRVIVAVDRVIINSTCASAARSIIDPSVNEEEQHYRQEIDRRPARALFVARWRPTIYPRRRSPVVVWLPGVSKGCRQPAFCAHLACCKIRI